MEANSAFFINTFVSGFNQILWLAEILEAWIMI